MENQTANSQEQITLREIINLVTLKWYWFAVSLVVCLALAFVHVMRQKPVYERYATVLIKESNVSRRSATDLESLLATQGQMTSKISNEIVSFSSPALMAETVRRLGLDTDYALEGRAHDHVVYGAQVPVLVDFAALEPGVSISLEIAPKADGSILVQGIRWRKEGKNFKIKKSLEGRVGDAFETPVGTLFVMANPYFEGGWERSLKVSHTSVAAAARRFLKNFSADPVNMKNNSDVLKLTITDFNTTRAEDILSMLITVYNENWVEDMNKMAVSTSLFIKDRLSNLEKELSGVDETISEFKSTNMMPDVQAMSSLYMTQNSELTRQIRQLENQLSVAKYLRNYLTNNINLDDLIPMPSGFGESGLSGQVSEYNSLVLKRNGIITNSSRTNPLVKDIDRSLESMRAAILATVDNQINQIDTEIGSISLQEKQNAGLIAESPNQAKALLSYEREQKVKETLYLFLLQKREENELSQAFTAYNTRVITPPYGSNLPISPKKTQIMLVAFLLGLAIPAGLLYLSQVANTRIRGKKDLEGLPYPFLGEVPQMHKPGERVDIFTNLVIPKERERGAVDIVVKPGSRDVLNEAFRVLRTNLEFMCGGDGEHRTFVTTSFNPSSGKTFVSINLAMALSLKGVKVLLVDGDFRRYSLSRSFNLQKSKGFADYLASSAETDPMKFVVEIPEHPNLYVLPVGTVPPNPSELLSGEKFGTAMAALKEKFNYVFVDCAPVDIVADTQIIAPVADRTIFVVRAGLLERDMLGEFADMGAEGKFNGMTLVLNGTDVDSARGYRYGSKYSYYYGRYGHHYGYGYGYGRHSKNGGYSYGDEAA